MKRCPRCNQTFDDATDFCVDDGTPLVAYNSFVSADVPTQFVGIPNSPQQQVPVESSKLLYGVIGGLIAIILSMGAYFLLIATSSDSNKAANSNSDQANRSSANIPDGNNIGANSLNNFRPTPVTNIASTMANAANTATNTAMPVANVQRGPALSRRFNSTFEGNVGDNGVEMDLQRNGSSLNGRVRPYDNSAEIYVEGSISDDGSFAMDEKSDIGVVTGAYRGRFNADGTVTGTWSKPDGEKTRTIFLRRQ